MNDNTFRESQATPLVHPSGTGLCLEYWLYFENIDPFIYRKILIISSVLCSWKSFNVSFSSAVLLKKDLKNTIILQRKPQARKICCRILNCDLFSSRSLGHYLDFFFRFRVLLLDSIFFFFSFFLFAIGYDNIYRNWRKNYLSFIPLLYLLWEENILQCKNFCKFSIPSAHGLKWCLIIGHRYQIIYH